MRLPAAFIALILRPLMKMRLLHGEEDRVWGGDVGVEKRVEHQGRNVE